MSPSTTRRTPSGTVSSFVISWSRACCRNASASFCQSSHVKSVARKEACLAFPRPMFRVQQIKNDFRPRHFRFVCEREFHFDFTCTLAAIPRAGRWPFSRMKPVASSWLWSHTCGIGSASVVVFILSFKQRRQISCAMQHADNLDSIFHRSVKDDAASNNQTPEVR